MKLEALPVGDRRIGGDYGDDIKKYRRRFSKHEISKKMALERVPFSSLLYVSKPLEGTLSRKRSQFYFFAIGCWTMMMAKEERHEFSAQHFKLTVLQMRSKQACFSKQQETAHVLDCFSKQINDSKNSSKYTLLSGFNLWHGLAEDFSFGLLLDGQEIINQPKRCTEDSSLVLSFTAPVLWNGWFLITSRTSPAALDPVRFVLYARGGGAGDAWRPVGSSGYARILVSTALFHTPYATPAARGARATFDLYRLRLGSIWQSTLMCFAMAAAGAARLEHLCKHVACAHFGVWVLVHAIRAIHYAAAGQWPAVVALTALGVMQLGNVLLIRRERYIFLIFWYSHCRL